MRYLLDTNIVSELRKGARYDPAVAAWEQAELIPQGGAISVLTIGEIRKGIDFSNSVPAHEVTLVLAVRAAHAGETLVQIAALEKGRHGACDYGARPARGCPPYWAANCSP